PVVVKSEFVTVVPAQLPRDRAVPVDDPALVKLQLSNEVDVQLPTRTAQLETLPDVDKLQLTKETPVSLARFTLAPLPPDEERSQSTRETVLQAATSRRKLLLGIPECLNSTPLTVMFEHPPRVRKKFEPSGTTTSVTPAT